MRPNLRTLLSSLLLASLHATTGAAEDYLKSTSLTQCQDSDVFSASVFDAIFTTSNNTLTYNIKGVSTISGYITVDIYVYAYGYKAWQHTLNPCEQDLKGLCPMQAAPLDIDSNLQLSDSDVAQIPSIAFTVPDIDAKVQAYIIKNDTGASIGCIEAGLTNGKTVDQAAVAWVTAVIAGLGLAASAITSGLGHSNTAAHVAANAMALFGYFQAQAFIGLTGVPLPPIVAGWTQNFQWSMGIIEVDFIQNIATWYQRATGGTPTTLLQKVGYSIITVEKRDLIRRMTNVAAGFAHGLARRSLAFAKRDDSNLDTNIVIRGIERVGFYAGIEISNIFMTGYIFFLVFVVFVVIGVLAFKGICELLTKMGHMRGDKFKDFRNGWSTILKGILFRIILIGFPQMVVLCFWEFTRDDSGAEITLAIFTIVAMLFILGWASSKVIRIARRSISMHKNPAYILYSDPVSLNKWGFLYVPFKATAYYFIVVTLTYILLKGLFVALAQNVWTVQAIALLIIEAAYLIGICILRPYMDKKTNAFNIAISATNFFSTLLLLFFTGVFNLPALATGIMGVIFAFYNAVFATVLLIMVLVASIIAMVAKNPDTRYQPMRDDRSSFIKSNTQLNTELDALGATARGEGKHGFGSLTKSGARIDDDDESLSGGSSGHNHPTAYNNGMYQQGHGVPMQQVDHHDGVARYDPPYVNRSGTASPYRDDYSRSGSMNSYSQHRPAGNTGYSTGGNGYSNVGYSGGGGGGGRATGASPWQRGAGYD